MATTAERIVQLQKDAQRATKLRAEAEAAVGVATQQLAQTDAELKALGIDPENCEQELSALEGQLDQLANELAVKVADEIRVYEGILTAAKAAGLR